MNSWSWVMIAVAVIPPLLLMIFITIKDKHDKEPLGLLVKCGIFGALSVLFSILFESMTMELIPKMMHTSSSIAYYAVLAFVGIAAVEETGKFLALRLATWKNRNFNYTFDGIVYSVYTSLGFALVENIVYVVRHGMKTGFLRAVTAIPGHASFGVYMGFFYGYAKFYEVAGNKSKKTMNLWLGWLVATILHGLYDFFALSGTEATMVLFFVFIIALDIIVMVQVHRSAKNDTPIYQAYQQPLYRMQFSQVYQNPYYAPRVQGYRAPVYLQQQYGNYGQNPYNPQNPYGQINLNGPGGAYGQNAYNRQNPFDRPNPYGQNPYGQNPNGQNPNGQNPYGQNNYGQQNIYGQPNANNPAGMNGRNPNAMTPPDTEDPGGSEGKTDNLKK